ncbi:MAG TPA: hypothetical protein VEX64_05250 [Pyrinomonadaceae bacterium]|jgi:hypothetical protein|nr:hypothetical protein [Pyrinomonadaceae bacterium]
MKIAKIVKSNSHIDYVGRVIDALDTSAPPSTDDYGFAQFVRLPLEDMTEVVGVIYDSQLLNPDYGSYGPRLSPQPELAVLSPDYLNEQGLLIGILLLGWRDRLKNEVWHGVPRCIVPVNQDVFRLSEEDFLAFHSSKEGKIRLHYYAQILSHANLFGSYLIESIVNNLSPMCCDEDRKRLGVLKSSLAWQRTLGNVKH